MPERPRIVIDTNILVSRLLFRHSIAAEAVKKAMSAYQLIVSLETLAELESVLSRPKFDKYLPLADRVQFFYRLNRTAFLVEKVEKIAVCRDPKDDKFLSLAISGRANLILSGDQDLLVLHPYRGIEILDLRQYMDQ